VQYKSQIKTVFTKRETRAGPESKLDVGKV